MRLWWPVVAALCIVAGSVLGDEIKKKDGTVLEGEIVAEDDDSVTIKHRLGEIKVSKTDIDVVTRGDSASTDLEKLKAETVAKLRELAERAARDQKKDAEKALRQLMEDVKAWSTRPRPPKKEKADEPTAPATDEKDKKPKASAADFVTVCEKLKKIWGDSKMTEVQRQKAAETYSQQMNGKPVRATVIVDEASTREQQGSTIVRGMAGGYQVALVFTEDADREKLEKVNKGAKIQVDGELQFESNYAWSYPMIGNPRLK